MAFLILFAGFAANIHAALLVSENFNYSIGSSIAGQNGGTGFSGPWFRRYTGSADGTIVAPLSFSDYPVSGNAVRLSATNPGDYSIADIRPLNNVFGAAPQTVWMSYLFSYTVTPGTSPAFYAGVNTTNNIYPDDRRFCVSGLNATPKFMASYVSPGGASSAATNSQSTTYLLIGKYVGGTGLTMWALSASNYDSIKAGGITEAELNAASFAKMTDNFDAGESNMLQTNLGIACTTGGTGSSLNVTMGSIKMGTTLDDVVPTVSRSLVWEDFNYPIGSSIVGQNGGAGFSGAWVRRYSASADGTIVAPLSFSDYPVSGNAVLLSAANPGAYSVADIRTLSNLFGAGPQTVWMSYLFSYTVTPGTFPAFYGGVNTTNNLYQDSVRFSLSGLNSMPKFMGSYQNPGGANCPDPNSQSTTYLLIGKYVGGVGMTMWVLSAESYDSIKANGITEAELNEINFGKAVDNFASGEANTLEANLGIGCITGGTNSLLKVTIGAVKMDTTLDKVAPTVPQIPLVNDQPPIGNWTLTFSEDFNSGVVQDTGTTASGGRNNPYLHTSQNDWNLGYWWNEVIDPNLQAFDWRNVSVVNGNCRILVEKRDCYNIGMNGNTKPPLQHYASGAIQTYKRFAQTYGYWVARIKMPTGKGTWPCFWMDPDRGPSSPNAAYRTAIGNHWEDPGLSQSGSCPMGNEIDILEYMNVWKNPITGLSLSHSGFFWDYDVDGASKGYFTYADQLLNPDTQYHTYGMYWGPGILKYYIDGNLVLSQTDAKHISVVPEFMMLACAVDQSNWRSTSPIPIADINAGMPCEMNVDYVRVYAGSPTIAPVGDGTYRLTPCNATSQCLEVAGAGTGDGANVDISAYTGSTNQQWTFTHLGNGVYSIKAVHSGKSLDVAGGGSSNGTNVRQFTDTGANEMRWTVLSTGSNGAFRIIPQVNTSASLEVSGGGTSNGTNVDIWSYGGNTYQQWKFEIVP